MTDPYEFVPFEFQQGILDDSVDATYIIHLENNGRLAHVMQQLSVHTPTKRVFLVKNKGFRKSKKPDFVTSPALDLVDAFITVFKHAHKFNNILVLEDDFMFSKWVDTHASNVNREVNQLSGEFIFLLGCIPCLQIPHTVDTFRVKSLGTHAIIYSKANRCHTLLVPQQSIKDWDWHNNASFNRFAYHKPLCYQLFPETENARTWGQGIHKLGPASAQVVRKLFKFLELDKTVEPGTSMCYLLSKWVPVIFMLAII